MINLTINGKSVQAEAGTTVLQAARNAGVEIPTLCDHPELTPYGGCRLCLVEVEGARTLQPSCTLPVSEKMVVRTDTPRVHEARKFVLSLIFSERNHFCPYCQVSGGDCELQNAAYAEGMTHWPLAPNWKPFPMDASHPYIILEHNRCILCRRCVRACGELIGNYTLEVEERGARTILVADLGVPLGESSCVSCGACVQVCPTGALIDRWSAYQGLDRTTESHKTICIGCSLGCNIDVQTRDNRLVRVNGDWDGEVNAGLTCKVGRFQVLEEDRGRITTPMVRKNGKLEIATWEEALAAAATAFKAAGSQTAALASARLPAEDLYAFKQLFEKGLGSGLVTSLEGGEFTAPPAKLAAEKGHAVEGRLTDLETADCVVVFGVDLTKTHEVAGFFIKRNLHQGTRLIVIDTAENGLDHHAQAVLKCKPGAEEDLLAALQAALSGKDFTAQAEKLGLAAVEIEKIAKWLTDANNPVIVYGKTHPALLKSLLTTSEMVNAVMLSIKGEANSLAAAQYQLDKPINLNGYQAVFVALSDQRATRQLTQMLEDVPFLVVQSAYASALTAAADVIFPVQMWAEQNGHYLNLDGHLQTAVASLTAPSGVRSSLEVFEALAHELNIQLDDGWKPALSQPVAAVPLHI